MKLAMTMKGIFASSVLALACGASSNPFASKPATPLAATANAPAAVGQVRAKEGSNDNTEASIKVDHLAPPGELNQRDSAYVAWVKPPGTNQWQNVGQLQVGQDRSGSLDITVPYQHFDVSVTAEPTATTQQRGGTVVLEGHVSR
jgi:hypothetical protein